MSQMIAQTWPEIGAELLATSGSFGWIGHTIARKRASRNTDHLLLQQLVWAVGGKPADAVGPRVPGLVEQVSLLADRISQHEQLHVEQLLPLVEEVAALRHGLRGLRDAYEAHLNGKS